jgi:hypothetical protein
MSCVEILVDHFTEQLYYWLDSYRTLPHASPEVNQWSTQNQPPERPVAGSVTIQLPSGEQAIVQLQDGSDVEMRVQLPTRTEHHTSHPDYPCKLQNNHPLIFP